ncbi:MAG TPA: outer membrane beta-barrel protein, partial [Ferruginibacter sp.]|nr:outer membrane beta-barrel protein [Ferruginibacter sp.]
MRKYILSLTILFVLTATSFAQGLKFGVKAGADIHKIEGKSFKDQFSFGYHAGGFLEIGLTSMLGIQPELLFSQVNVDTSSSFSSVYQFNKISEVNLKYINIPLLLNIKPNKFVALQLGPQFGILIDQDKGLLKS